MERSEISRHEVEIVRVLSGHQGKWLSNAEIGGQLQIKVSPRTIRATTLKLVKIGILDQAEVFPAHRYRLSGFAANRDRGYWDRVNRAAEVFGVSIATKVN